jgi:hypothetical protein
MALSTSRMSVVRGCPPGLAGGISGSRIAHSRSLRSLGYSLRCIVSLPPSFPSRVSFPFFTPPSWYHLIPFFPEPLAKAFYRLCLPSTNFSGLCTQPLKSDQAFERVSCTSAGRGDVEKLSVLGATQVTVSLKTVFHSAVRNCEIVQIAMSPGDTTTDENELAMGYTVGQERLRRGRALDLVPRACYKSDRRRLQAPTVCCSQAGST